MSKQVIVYPRGQLTKADKEKLRRAGFVAIEADDPKSVVVVLPSAPLATGDDMLMAAMWGLSTDRIGPTRDNFFAELHRRMRLRESQDQTSAGAG